MRRKWRRGREGGIRTHHRGIKQVNHILFSLCFLAQRRRGCLDCDVGPLVFGSIGPTLLSSLKYFNNFWTDIHAMWQDFENTLIFFLWWQRRQSKIKNILRGFLGNLLWIIISPRSMNHNDYHDLTLLTFADIFQNDEPFKFTCTFVSKVRTLNWMSGWPWTR